MLATHRELAGRRRRNTGRHAFFQQLANAYPARAANAFDALSKTKALFVLSRKVFMWIYSHDAVRPTENVDVSDYG